MNLDSHYQHLDCAKLNQEDFDKKIIDIDELYEISFYLIICLFATPDLGQIS